MCYSQVESSTVLERVVQKKVMKIRAIVKICLLVGLGLNTFLVFGSSLNRWIEFVAPGSALSFESGSLEKNNTTAVMNNSSDDVGLRWSRVLLVERKDVLSSGVREHYGKWGATALMPSIEAEMALWSPARPITILVELTGELGNHLNHIAHGRAIQTMLWQDHGVPSHLVLRRNSNGEKYLRTQRQLKRCFPNLRPLEFHGPKSYMTSQKELDRLQSTLLGPDLSKSLFLDGGSTFAATQASVQELVNLLQNREGDFLVDAAICDSSPVNATLSCNRYFLSRDHGVSLPFLRTRSMVNREFLDKFYDDFRDFFKFDDEACCATAELPEPDVAVFVSHDKRQCCFFAK